MREKLSDKYTVDELANKAFPWAIIVMVILVLIWVITCIINPWNIVIIPLVICGLGLVGCVVVCVACGLAEGIAHLIYMLEGAEE